MKKFGILLGLLAFGFIFMPGNADAAGLNCHLKATLEAISDAQDSNIKRIVMANQDAYMACLVDPDKAVLFYYSKYPFGSQYADTHNPNLPQEMLARAKDDRERACAYGYQTHHAQDAIVHNLWIPLKIQQTHMPNWIIHPISEAAAETHCLDPRVTTIYGAMFTKDPVAGRTLAEFTNQVVGQDYSSEQQILKQALATQPDKLWGGLSTPVSQSSPLFWYYEQVSKGNWWLGALIIAIGALIVFAAVKWLPLFAKPVIIIIGSLLAIMGYVTFAGLGNITDTSDFFSPQIYGKMVSDTVLVLQGVPTSLDPTGAGSIVPVDLVPASGLFIFIAAIIGTMMLAIVVPVLQWLRGR